MRHHHLASLLLMFCLAAAALAARETSLILATTTSTQDSGLLDVLLPAFERASGIKVRVIAVGTGEALAMGRRGDADVLMVHSRKAEDEFMAQGFGLVRFDVMHNDFVLIGPAGDPAMAEGLDAVVAFRRVAAAKCRFLSRGDESGTHKKEREIWREAGIDPKGDWFISTGQGQGESTRIASEKQAYMLIDRGTYLALKATLKLRLITDDCVYLLNPYGVIVVNPAKNAKVRATAARSFADWLVTPATQRMIGQFGVDKFGRALFVPDAVR